MKILTTQAVSHTDGSALMDGFRTHSHFNVGEFLDFDDDTNTW